MSPKRKQHVILLTVSAHPDLTAAQSAARDAILQDLMGHIK